MQYPLSTKLQRIAQLLRDQNLSDQATSIDEVVDSSHPEEYDRPLLEAVPTDPIRQPGTWSKPDGSIVKVSKEPDVTSEQLDIFLE
jgi:hypothetical protein